MEKCWKIGKDICDPSPCGNNSICVRGEGRVKPYCICEKGFYGKPPNCRLGCRNSTECADNEYCDENHSCIDPCKNSPCGDNSECKSGNHSKAVCSCMDGFFPQSGVGCRPEEGKDKKIDFQCLKNELKVKCLNCPLNAICDVDGSCKCSQGFMTDLKGDCIVDPKPNKTDKCSPQPCGPFASCKIIEDHYNCTCLDGYLGSPPYCTPCTTSLECDGKKICLNQKCVKNPCETFCGKFSDCGISESGKIECSCGVEGNPFKECLWPMFILQETCEDGAVKPECGVQLSDITKVILASG